MALWKDPVTRKVQQEPTPIIKQPPARENDKGATIYEPARRPAVRAEARESLIAADLTIEGKIEGSGHVRIAGRFNGDVNVQGNLTIEPGAKLTGEVRAKAIVVGGELEGNIDAASSVELTETGVLSGDVKAASLTVAAGSRMRGRVEFGWEGRAGDRPAVKKGDGPAT